ncbi:MAG: hypothetical protein LBV16_01315 [Elusimicrobiota bacterium]|jgi:hypothetical protein|nr:hypothetical protein [Elusimicrobiota bacterium]
MIQNIIIAIIALGAIILAIRHFKKGKCSCCGGSDDKKKMSACKLCDKENK